MSKTLQGHRTKLNKTKTNKKDRIKAPTVSSRGQTTVRPIAYFPLHYVVIGYTLRPT